MTSAIINASEVSRLSAGAGTLVILGAEAGPVDLGKMLIAAGWPDSTPLAITWNGTTTDQHTVVGTLGSRGRRPQGGRASAR